MKIELFEMDDWVNLVVDGKSFYSGHSVPTHTWIELLYRCGEESVAIERIDVPVTKYGDPIHEQPYPFIGGHPGPGE